MARLHDDRAVQGYALARRVAAALRPRYPTLDAEDLYDAAVDGLLDGLDRPDRTAPLSRQHLWVAADRNARNRVAAETARRRRESRWAAERLAEARQPLAADGVGPREAIEEIWRLVAHLLPDERMRVVLRLRLQGERRTEVFAVALGLDSLKATEQRRAVKQEKDRLLKHMQRHEEVTRAVQAALGSFWTRS